MPVDTMRWAVERGYCTRFIEHELHRHFARHHHPSAFRWAPAGAVVGE